MTDLARHEVVTANRDTSVSELSSIMKKEQVGSVVITNDQEPVGIVTDRDIATRAFEGNSNPREMTAQDIMSESVCAAEEQTGLNEALEIMEEEGVRRLPICGSDGKLSGIVTFDDLTELISNEEESMANIVSSQRPAY
jgi:CBS domain-containing protein